jgi:phage baseplate assembly protein V
MLRFGQISEIDVSKCYARVKFFDDGIVSAPLQIVVMGALSTKFFHIFDINEQVACLMDENSEDGVILGAVFSDGVNPDGGNKDVVRVKFPDDSFIEYDRNLHVYNLNIQGNINIVSTSEINIEAPAVNIDAEVVTATATTINADAQTVNVDCETANITATETNIESVVKIIGNVDVTGNLIASGTVTASTAISTPSLSGPGVTMSGGNLVATGSITGADVVAGTVNLETHVHGGVSTGSGSTAPPTP